MALSVMFTFGLSMTAMAKYQPTNDAWTELATCGFEQETGYSFANAGSDPEFAGRASNGDGNGTIAAKSGDYYALVKRTAKGQGMKVLDTITFDAEDVGKTIRVTAQLYVEETAGSDAKENTTVRMSMIGKETSLPDGKKPTTDTTTYSTGELNINKGVWTPFSIEFTVTADVTVAGRYGDLRFDGGKDANYAAKLYVDDIVWEEKGETAYEDIPLSYTQDFEAYDVGNYSNSGDPFISSGGENSAGPEVVENEQAHSATKSVKKYNRYSNNGAIKFLNVFQSALVEQDLGKAFHISAWVYLDKSGGLYYKDYDKTNNLSFPVTDEEEIAASEGQVVNIGMYGPQGTKYSTTAYQIVSKYVKWNTWTPLDIYFTIDEGAVTDSVNAVRFCQVGQYPFAGTFYVDDFAIEEIDPSEIPAPAVDPTVTMSEAKAAANGAQDAYYYVTTVDLGTDCDIYKISTYFVPEDLKDDKENYTVDEIEVPEIVSMDGGNGTVTFASVLTGIPDDAKDRAIYANSSVYFFNGATTTTVSDEDTTTLNTVLAPAQ